MEDLLFFNTDGFAYNVTDTNGYYEAKLMFDENSSDTYKTLGLYVFESVAPKYFNCLANLNQIEIFDYSGMSFYAMNNSYSTINDIENVNSNQFFHSKWVYGKNFELLFPQGSIVRFSGVTFNITTNDFNELYYSVVETKPGAMMVVTPTENDWWSQSSITFISGSIESLNIISVHNYVNPYNFYYDKKISVVNSTSNDGVYSYIDSGLTYYSTYEFDLNAITGNTLKLNVDLYTERPVIYDGALTITYNDSSVTGITIDFNTYIKTASILEIGDTFYVENDNANAIFYNNPEFVISDVIKYDILYNNVVTYFYRTINKNFTMYNINQKSYNVTYEQTILNSSYIGLQKLNYFIEFIANWNNTFNW